MNKKLYTQDDVDDLQNRMHDIKRLIHPSDEVEFYDCDVVNDSLDDLVKPQLTLEELRDQFEATNALEYLVKRSDGRYISYYVRELWKGFKQCAKANNILREVTE